jgi:hypothetical protein
MVKTCDRDNFASRTLLRVGDGAVLGNSTENTWVVSLLAQTEADSPVICNKFLMCLFDGQYAIRVQLEMHVHAKTCDRDNFRSRTLLRVGDGAALGNLMKNAWVVSDLP